MQNHILLTTIPSDSHSWNLVYLQQFLEESGYPVVNLGTCVSFEQTESRCAETLPRALVVSTLNGHGHIEGVELATRLRPLCERTGMKLYIGGNLGVGTETAENVAADLERAGFDAVYHDTSPEEFLNLLRDDFADVTPLQASAL